MQGKDGDNKGKAQRCLSKTEERLRHHAPEHSKEGGWWGRKAAGLQYAGCLHYKVSTDGDVSTHGNQVKAGEDCSIHCVKEPLHYGMNTLDGLTPGNYAANCSIHSVKDYLRYGMGTFGGSGAGKLEFAPENRFVDWDRDCSTHSVNRWLRDNMNTFEKYCVGASGDDIDGYESNCSTNSVKVSLRHKMSTGDDGLSVNEAGEDRSINSVKKSLRDSMGTWVRTGMGAVSCGTDGCTVGKKSNCSMDSVKDCLRDEMDTIYGDAQSEVDCDSINSSTADTRNCSTNSVNGCLRYDMTQLGSFVSLLEFNLKERYYRYSKSYYGGHRAKVIDNIGVMVFIPF